MENKNIRLSGELQNNTLENEVTGEEKNAILLQTTIELSNEKEEINNENVEIACAELEMKINRYRDDIDDQLSANNNLDA